jgi:hypothetical protein
MVHEYYAMNLPPFALRSLLENYRCSIMELPLNASSGPAVLSILALMRASMVCFPPVRTDGK